MHVVHEDFETRNEAVELLVKIATALRADPDLPRHQMRDTFPQEYRAAHPEPTEKLKAVGVGEMKAPTEMPSAKSAEDDGCDDVSRSTQPPPPKKAKVGTRGAASASAMPELSNFVDIDGVHAV